MNELLRQDRNRYKGNEKIPYVQVLFRKCQEHNNLIHNILFKIVKKIMLIELSPHTKIAGGLYLGHASSITITPDCIIGSNVNIHKGVTIGRENRGKREGCPTIGNNVWIGINATIVGKVNIGNDVLIAPNSFVNIDVPDHSIVIGNPATIKHADNATAGYVENCIRNISDSGVKL